MKHWLIRSAFVLLIIVLVFSNRTDADLSDQELVAGNFLTVANLDINNQDSANMQPKSGLFQISGLVPTGFQVESVRIRNEGTFVLEYLVQPSQISGGPLCSNLELTVLKSWQIIYQGILADFSYSAQLDEDTFDDLVFSLALNSSDSSLQQSSCSFAFLVKSTLDAAITPLYDEELLQNQVISGTW